MNLADFDFHLPPELIAQHPARRRSDSRMLVLRRDANELQDRHFRDLPEILAAGDLLAMNNTRVIHARLFGHRAGQGTMPIGPHHPKRGEYLTARVEALLARQIDERTWEALVHPGRKIRVGELLTFDASGVADKLEAEVVSRGEYGLRTLRFKQARGLAKKIDRIGHIPLPPYIERPAKEWNERADRLRYQTVYAQSAGSVAAPTAGLHFTRPILKKLAERGVERAEITLHVGLGTFQPIHTERIEEHVMHPETYDVSVQAAKQLSRARREHRRIIAVGTTTVRTLESVAAEHQGRMCAASGETRLFIKPGFDFQVVGGMLTNFHLPRSTLLMLISAFAGRERILAAYEHAVRERYRFYSYGDCMLIL
jgi:S-adenosylmethionine:tRNA ribosyltransferase-isomerase